MNSITTMQEEINEFVEALLPLRSNEIKRVTDPIYAARRASKSWMPKPYLPPHRYVTYRKRHNALPRASDEDMQTVPNRQRMYRIARNYWNG